MTLIEVLAVNLRWAENEVHQYRTADISVVMTIRGGLSTPVVRSAESKSVWSISHELKELASRAENNALRMDEAFGGSFSISNLDMHNVDQFDAIINPPQCAILAVGTAKPRLVLSEDRNVRIATVMCVTLSADHRVIDGVTGARFLAVLRTRLEQPALLRPTE
jgi:pyruvate dehydrogenase E2 component (dihydrolipoamide acetyltransferase)